MLNDFTYCVMVLKHERIICFNDCRWHIKRSDPELSESLKGGEPDQKETRRPQKRRDEIPDKKKNSSPRMLLNDPEIPASNEKRGVVGSYHPGEENR